MEIRKTFKDSAMNGRRRHSGITLTTTTLTGFEYWCAAFFGSNTVEHFTFSTATAPGAYYSLTFAGVTDSRHYLCNLCPLLPV
ncbi:Uncharacterised protein [Salmonella enterica subsp. enterica]|nr:Uncharacterised protein [Salmonella enterica subsp. enterica]